MEDGLKNDKAEGDKSTLPEALDSLWHPPGNQAFLQELVLGPSIIFQVVSGFICRRLLPQPQAFLAGLRWETPSGLRVGSKVSFLIKSTERVKVEENLFNTLPLTQKLKRGKSLSAWEAEAG